MRYLFSLLTLASIFAGSPCPAQPRAPYVEEAFTLGGSYENLVLIDMDGDERVDLVGVRPGRFEVWLQTEASRFETRRPPIVLGVPGQSVGWEIADVSGYGGRQVVALVDGKEVWSWALDRKARRFGDGVRLLEGLRGTLPRGFYHVPLVRSVDGDAQGDLIIPVAGTFQIWLREPGGGFRSPVTVAADFGVEVSLETDLDLASAWGQSLSLPSFQLRDVDGDGRKDLVAESEERFDVHQALPGGSFAATPTRSVDLAALKKRLGGRNPEKVDFSNLSAQISRTVQVLSEDLDGDGAEELLLREAGKISLFRGRRGDLSTRKPDQILKASGNVVYALLHDEDGDGRRDLWLIRVETVSIGDVFLWLVASGSLDVDVFVYRFEGERLARRPTRRLDLTVRFPSILNLIEEGKRVGEQLGKDVELPATVADLRGSGEPRDIVVLSDGAFRAYHDRVGEVGPQPTLFELLGYRSDRDEYTVDLHRMDDLLVLLRNDLGERVDGVQPSFRVPMAELGDSPGLWARDLDGDGRDEVLVIHHHSSGNLRGSVLWSRGAGK